MNFTSTQEAVTYLRGMKKKYPDHEVMSELNVDGDIVHYRDCCTEIINKLNDEQILNIAHSIALLDESSFFTAIL